MTELSERLRRMATPNPQIKDDVIRVDVLAPLLIEVADAIERTSAETAS